jgi:hypothetical protein
MGHAHMMRFDGGAMMGVYGAILGSDTGNDEASEGTAGTCSNFHVVG